MDVRKGRVMDWRENQSDCRERSYVLLYHGQEHGRFRVFGCGAGTLGIIDARTLDGKSCYDRHSTQGSDLQSRVKSIFGLQNRRTSEGPIILRVLADQYHKLSVTSAHGM